VGLSNGIGGDFAPEWDGTLLRNTQSTEVKNYINNVCGLYI